MADELASLVLQWALRALNSKSISDTMEALHFLAECGDRRAAPTIASILARTRSHAVRDVAALALMDLRDPGALPVLIWVLAKPETVGHRGTLVHALSAFDCSQVFDRLIELFLDGSYEVRIGIACRIENLYLDSVPSDKRASGGARLEGALGPDTCEQDREEIAALLGLLGISTSEG